MTTSELYFFITSGKYVRHHGYFKEITKASTWNNEHIRIDDECVNYRNWAHNLIQNVNHINDEPGNGVSYQNCERLYNFKHTFLQFYWIMVALNK